MKVHYSTYMGVVILFFLNPIDHFLNRLNVSLMNHFLRNSVAVTLQSPREAGAVYSVNVSPLTEMNTAMSHDMTAL